MKNLNKILNFTIFILNLLLISSLISFTILFSLKVQINSLENFIIIISIAAILIKLFCWYLIKNDYEQNTGNFFTKLTIHFFTYVTPSYYILQKPYLILNDDVIFFTLILLSIIAITGIIIEKYIKINESKILFTDTKNIK